MDNFLKAIHENDEAVNVLAEWGFTLPKSTLTVEGRTMAAPKLTFGSGYEEVVNERGDWNRTATNKPVLKCVPLKKWTLIFPSKDERVAKSFIDSMIQQSPRMGLNCVKPNVVALDIDNVSKYVEAVKKIDVDENQIVVTLFSGPMRADRYSAMKKLCYVDLGIQSQVVMTKTLANERRMQSVVQKIALQINCKLGGESWGCQIPAKLGTIMFVGIDIYK